MVKSGGGVQQHETCDTYCKSNFAGEYNGHIFISILIHNNYLYLGWEDKATQKAFEVISFSRGFENFCV